MFRAGAVALSVALVLSTGVSVPSAWASAAEGEQAPPEQTITAAGDAPATPEQSTAAAEEASPAASSEEEQSPAGGVDEGLTSLTLSVYEIVFYDDPSFNEPGGLRLMETKVIDGLKVGETIDLWDYVETHDDFFFFDGWPRYITLSENPEENRAQLHYMRTKSPSVVNYYLVGEAGEAPLMKAAPIIDDVEGVPVSFWKMGSYQVESLPLGVQIASEQCAVELDGLVYLDADKDSIEVEPLAASNEINLFYTVDTAATLPDDVPVEDTTVTDRPGTSDSGTGDDSDAGDGSGDTGASTGTAGAGSSSEDDSTSESGAAEGSDGGASADSDEAGQPSAGDADGDATIVIEDEPSPLAAAHEGVLTLPQTGDATAPLTGLLALAAGAATLIGFARHRSSRHS